METGKRETEMQTVRSEDLSVAQIAQILAILEVKAFPTADEIIFMLKHKHGDNQIKFINWSKV